MTDEGRSPYETVGAVAEAVRKPIRQARTLQLWTLIAVTVASGLMLTTLFGVGGFLASRHERQVETNRQVRAEICAIVNALTDLAAAPDAGTLRLRAVIDCPVPVRR